MYLQQARKLLEVDTYFFKNPRDGANYFVQNSEDEETKLHSPNLQKMYMNFKSNLFSARDALLKDNTEQKAKNFVEAYNGLAAFKAQLGFTYYSYNHYYESQINNPVNYMSQKLAVLSF